MARRLSLLLVLALVAASPALADLGGKKASVDAKLAQVQGKIAQSRARAHALGTQITGLTSQIRVLEGRVGGVSSRLAALQSDLALRQRRLDKLDELYRLQTVRLRDLKRQYELSVRRLNHRLIAIYKQEDPTTIDVLLTAKSFQDVLDQLDYLGAIAKQDKRVATAVAKAKGEVKAARSKTAGVRRGVAQEKRALDARAQQQAILRGQLLASQSQLAGARVSKSTALKATKAQIAAEVSESVALAAASQQIAARLRAAEAAAAAAARAAASTPAPSGDTTSGAPTSGVPTVAPSGLAWPVSGPITSPFGMRWGRMHEGIDFGVPSGTPIHAAAAGTVVYCGWMEGYGNLTVIEHGGGIATAYGHQSSISVSCNQQVSQGQVIGAVGNTGHSTGPHLHFEVRVNGTPVDPLGYL
jgi:murein DD-endopeptidase MepM/ murein hydrolase activator NlpD